VFWNVEGGFGGANDLGIGVLGRHLNISLW
jgi:hypothetical protein